MKYQGASSSHYYGRTTQQGFGGIKHTPAAGDGDIFEAINMCSDEYPVLSTRALCHKRMKLNLSTVKYEEVLPGMSECYAAEMFNGKLFAVGKSEGDTQDRAFIESEEKTFSIPTLDKKPSICKIGSYICIFPCRYFIDERAFKANHIDVALENPYNTEYYREIGNVIHCYEGSEFSTAHDARFYSFDSAGWHQFCDNGWLWKNYVGHGVFSDGTYGGVSACGNTLTLEGGASYGLFKPFEVGEAVRIFGDCNAANKKTAIIREVEVTENSTILRFYENTFVNETVTNLKVSREVPKLDFAFTFNNRIWGYEGKTIYCSKLGNPFTWYDYESLADGAWAADIADGEFTAACAYGYPRFFTKDRLYTIYGDYPMEFQYIESRIVGVKKGEERSLATVGGALLYNSPYGIMCYTGSYPYPVCEDLGNRRFHDAIGGADGFKYYISCLDEENTAHTFVYDLRCGIWHEHENAFGERISDFVSGDTLLGIINNAVYTIDNDKVYPKQEGGLTWFIDECSLAHEEDHSKPSELSSYVLFAPWTGGSTSKKQVKEIHIRHEIEDEVEARLYIDGELEPSFTARLYGNCMSVLPGIPKRCDYWQLELRGRGSWRILDIAYSYYEGTVR